MSLSDLASLGSFVSGVAVLASLIFLYFQLRQLTQQVKQTEKNQQATIMQGRANQAVDANLRGADPSLSEALSRGSRGQENLSETTLRQVHQYWRATFFIWQDSFDQYAAGLSTEKTLEVHRSNLKSRLGDIGVRTQWRLQRKSFGREFVAWIDNLLIETPMEEFADPVVMWREALTAERSGAPY